MRAFVALCFIAVSFFAYSQSIPRLTEIADDLFEKKRYLEAIEFYEKISKIDKKNYQAKFRLGFCFFQTLKYEKAKTTFSSLGLNNDADNIFRARALYNYANLLKLESHFEDADSLFSFLIVLPDAASELIALSRKQKEGCQLAMRQKEVDKGFKVSLLDGVNSKFHDFGAVVNPSNKQLVFATTRKISGRQYVGSQYDGVLPDLASFRFDRKRWKESTNAQRFSQINSEWSEGSGSFTKDGKIFYFSSCEGQQREEDVEREEKDEQKTIADCGIFVTYLVDGKWTKPVALNEYINEPGSENKQPAISAGGDTLFFSSNRAGGYGGSDIWMSLRGLEAESWTPAINMGNVINTAENDITPYYSVAYNCLLFSSNGHVGYGGYDLYAAKGESFFEPEIYNLGYPFNSTIDDTYFAISDTVGFLSSNREDKRNLNLYYFPVSDERLFLSLLISGESLIDSRIASRFKDVRSLDLFTFRVEDYQGYELFEPVKRDKPKPAIIRSDDQLEVEQEQSEPVVATNTSLSGQSVKNGKHPEYAYNTSPIVGNRDYGYENDYEHVYFANASTQLQSVTKESLKQLAEQLDVNQINSIDVLAYTDYIGSDEFNMKLSNDRGVTIKNYLIEQGIPVEKIRVLARGEGPLNSRTSWYSRMFSRRAEIIINSDAYVPLKRAKPYAVRYESTISKIADQLGISLDELKKWNDFKIPIVKSGTIIRIGEEYGVVPNIKYFLEENDIRNTFFVYSVKEGETLQTIAQKYNTPEELLLEVNHVDGALKPGDQIFVYRIN